MKPTASTDLSGSQKMRARKKRVILVVVLSLCAGMLVFHQTSKDLSILRPTESPIYDYHARNLTYLEELNNAKVQMNDPLLITAIREKFLVPPLPLNVPYNLNNPYLDDISIEMAEHIAYIQRYEINGFFVDARAYDGEKRSNTIILERRLNWSGLLVEPDPINVAQIIKKQRKAWLSPSCLSTSTYPHVITISQDLNTEKTSKFGPKRIGFTDVQCLPLYSLLLALNRTVVDYLSLNVKGNELDVLKTIPFKDLNINMLSLDYSHEQEGKGRMLLYMQNQGYDLSLSAVHPDDQSLVFIFFKHKPMSEL